MYKRGISHIEAILSFVLFIGFVFVGLYFFTPSGNNTLIDSSLKYTSNKIITENAVEVMSFSVKIYTNDIPGGQETVAIEFPSEITKIPLNYVVRAESYSGQVLPATRNGDMVYVDFGNEDFTIVKFSEDFSQGPQASGTPEHDPNYYGVASSNIRNIISEKKLLEMNSSYYSDYNALKEKYNIPNSVSFGYQINIGDRNILAPLKIPAGVDVYSTINRRELLETNGKISFAEIGVRIW